VIADARVAILAPPAIPALSRYRPDDRSAPVAAVVLCGLAPLLSYFVDYSFGMCVLATGLVFFVIGAVKSQWSPSGWIHSGLETLLIGMTAAGISYAIGYGLKVLMHVSV
jgi:VIT1/CCC1 family predicted Fe2+/Mn2+ transporter